jgi:hypothetical protein
VRFFLFVSVLITSTSSVVFLFLLAFVSHFFTHYLSIYFPLFSLILDQCDEQAPYGSEMTSLSCPFLPAALAAVFVFVFVSVLVSTLVYTLSINVRSYGSETTSLSCPLAPAAPGAVVDVVVANRGGESNALRIQYGVPPPTISGGVSADGDDRSVIVTFEPISGGDDDADGDGVADFVYTVIASPGGATATAATSPITVSPLQVGFV